MVNPNPRRKRHLVETETIVETELIAEMKNSREISANEGLLGLGFSAVKIKDLGEGRAQPEESSMEKLGHRRGGAAAQHGHGCGRGGGVARCGREELGRGSGEVCGRGCSAKRRIWRRRMKNEKEIEIRPYG
jgi:hypothetical protein